LRGRAIDATIRIGPDHEGRDWRYPMATRLHLFKSKIHRATVTHADIDYEGSVTISGELMDAADILEHEQVHVWNITRGTRLITYALRGEDHSGVICLNGAAAHLAGPGDLVILATFAEVEAQVARAFTPKVVFVDEHNRAVDPGRLERPGPQRVATIR
jgi:aspartate 1-decarboxylase